MPDEKAQTGKDAAEEAPVPLRTRAQEWVHHGWRPAGTLAAVALALLVGWGVVNGNHGLSAWQQQRAQDKQLRQQIQELQQENARLRDHIEHLKSDPNAIEHEAREQLHYARPGEVIYTLPAPPQGQAQPADSGK
jgi:cell division protein FtsB